MGRYTLVRQSEAGDGGAAALATVCLHHGIAVELSQLRLLAGPGLQGLSRLAEQLGLTPRYVKTGFDQLSSLPLPALAPVRAASGSEQIVVVHRANRQSVVVADPAQERIQTLARDAFCQLWTGKVLLLTPASAEAALGPAGASPGRRLMSLLLGQGVFLIEALLCAALSALLAVAGAYVLRHLIDGGLARGEVGLLSPLVLGLVFVVAFTAAFALLRDQLLLAVGRRLDALLTARYVQRLARLPLSFFEAEGPAAIQVRLQASWRLRTALGTAGLGTIFDSVTVLVGLAVLALVDWRLAGVVGAALLLVGALVGLTGPGLAVLAERAADEEDHLGADLVAQALGAETLRGCGAERPRAEESERRLVGWLHAGWGIERGALWLRSGARLILGLGLVGVVWFAGKGQLSTGQLVFVLAVSVLALEATRRLIEALPALRQGLTALGRLASVLDAPAEGSGGRRKAVFQELHRGIELLNVSFAYPGRSKALDGVNLTVPAGRTIAIVGPSGSGKSTLLRLLHGQIEATDGQVRADGVDLRDIDPVSLRDHVGWVSQEPHVFRATVAENIALGNPEAGLAEITAAVRAVGLEEFVNQLPRRFDTLLAEGGHDLSAGQRQQVALARALLRQPRVLLLDDATSALDPAQERAALDATRWSLPGRTLLIVARRLAAVRQADWIYVMHQGKVAEAGPHADLMAANGLYAEMWRSQGNLNESSAQQDSLASLPTHSISRAAKR